MSIGIVGQALYTWASKLPNGRNGYGFVTASPSFNNKLEWVEAQTKGITNFSGSGRNMTPEERATYIPIGRRVSTKSTFGYRKIDAGRDASRRLGRYIVHFLIADATSLTLSELLRIRPSLWLDGNKCILDFVPILEDCPSGSISSTAELLTCDPTDLEHVAHGVEMLARGRTLDVAGWSDAKIRTVMACLPAWCDAVAELEPRWAQGGPSVKLSLSLHSPGRADNIDRRDSVAETGLLTLKDRLDDARDGDSLARAFEPRRPGPKPLITTDSRHEDSVEPSKVDNIREALLTWLRSGSKALRARDRELLSMDYHRTMTVLKTDAKRLPSHSGRRLDDLAIDILRGCPDVDSELVASILPLDDASIEAYLAYVTTPALLKASLFINRYAEHVIDIPITRKIHDVVFADLVESCKAPEIAVLALAKTMRLSMHGTGTFWKALLRAHAVDYQFLFERVIPRAAKNSNDLIRLVGENPEEFVKWLGVEKPYKNALIEALGTETNQDFWQRFSAALLGRGKWS